MKSETHSFSFNIRPGMMRMAMVIWLAVSWPATLWAVPVAVHHLDIHINPSDHGLRGRDRVEVVSPGVRQLKFRLSDRMAIDEIRVNQKPRQASMDNGWLSIPIAAAEMDQTVVIEIGYSGKFKDPAPINPINTDNPGYGVSASISERGCLLLSGSGWYPELGGAKAVYNLKIQAPSGWLAVTAGRLIAHRREAMHSISEFVSENPVEGLSLSVAPFKVSTKTSGNLKAAAYLLADDPDLARRYLDASLKYLELYSGLIGPYAFDRFAVVENFFPTGYGFPGYTLLGSQVLRLPFIIGTSLGHEIAHCWWGNGVTVAHSQGNWSEGLTTYLADYLYKERQSPAEALAYRRQMLRNYASLVPPESEFALARFSGRNSPLTKAIGYDKGAMVFHMLRRQIGDDAFWGGLRDIYRQRLFQRTAWSDLQAAFEQRAGRPLATFFNQWVTRKGAPQIRLSNVDLTRSREAGPWTIKGTIRQDGAVYEFPADLRVHTASGYFDHAIHIQAHRTDFDITAADAPRRIELDPRIDLFRRLDQSEIPPTVNSLKGGGRVALLLSDKGPSIARAAETLVASLGISHTEALSMDSFEQDPLPPVDILVVGRPPMRGQLAGLISRNVDEPDTIRLDGRDYNQPQDAFFGVYRHPGAPDRVIGYFWPLDREGAAAARKITHYGKYSYLIFRGGRNIAKGTWPVENSPVAHRWQ